MPIMNGLLACTEIKKMHPDIPIIMDSAYFTQFDCSQVFASGCDDYNIKPYRKEHFLAKVGQYLDGIKR
jgi:CheY-like chemotaxis protein